MTETATTAPIDDATIDGWAAAIGLGTALVERPDEVRTAARDALALAAALGMLDDSSAPPWPVVAP